MMDTGGGGDPKFNKNISGIVHGEEKLALRSHGVRSCHKTVYNKHLKQFQCLCSEFCHDILLHAKRFRAVAVLTKLSIEHDMPLFSVDYYDDNVDEEISS
jgi:hypothetical protein